MSATKELTDEQRTQIAAAKARGCSGCRQPIPEDARVRCLRRFDALGVDVLCVSCVERNEALRAEEEKRRAESDRRRWLRAFDQSFADSCVGARLAREANEAERAYLSGWEGVELGTSAVGPLRFPKWTWARFYNAEFRQRVDPRLLEVIESYEPDRDGSLVDCAPTGRGKSSLVVAWIWRLHDVLRGRVAAGEKHSMGFAWVSGFELAGARKRSQLGDESPLVKHASDVGLLVLDDVGCEPPGEETFVVLDARYRAQRPTILTSPLEPKNLIGHLGGGAYRRLLEGGRLVEAFGEAPKTKATVRVVK